MIGCRRRLSSLLAALTVAACSATPIPAATLPTDVARTTAPTEPSDITARPDAATAEASAAGSADHCSRSEFPQLAYVVDGMTDVEVRCDIVYKTLDDGTELAFDLYLPPGTEPGASLPVVVLVHGNVVTDPLQTIREQWKRDMYGHGLVVAATGMAAVSVGYRGYSLGDDEELAAAEQDVVDAVTYLGAHSEELSVDSARACYWTSSGGGIPGAWAALTAEPRAKCAVVFSGAVHPAFAPVISPIERLTADSPPFLVINGRSDGEAVAGTTPFASAAASVRAPVTVVEHSGGHGWEQHDSEETRRLVGDALAFMVENLGSAGP